MSLPLVKKIAGWRSSVRLPVLASFGFTAVSLVAKLMLVVFTPLITRLLSPAEYGVYTLYASWVGVFTVLCTLDLAGSGLYRGLQKWGREKAPTFLFSASLLILLPFLSVFLLFFAARGTVSSFLGLPAPLLFFLFAEVLGDALLSVSSAFCRYYSHPLRYAVTTLSVTFFSLLFTVLLIRADLLRAEARVVSTAIVTLFVGIAASFFLYKNKKISFSPDVWGFLCRYSLPLFPHALCLCFLTGIGRLSVGKYLGTAELSVYGLAYSIGMVPCFLTVGIQSSYQPWLLRKTAAGEKKEIGKMTNTLAFAVGAVCLSVTLTAPEAVAILAPESYGAALDFVGILSLSVFPLFLYNVEAGIELYYEKTWRLSAATIPVTLLSAAGFLYFVPRYGLSAAAILTPVSYLLLCFSHFLSLKKTARTFRFPFFRLLLLYAAFAAATVAAPRIYGSFVLRYSAVLLLGSAALYLLYRRKDLLLEPKGTVS